MSTAATVGDWVLISVMIAIFAPMWYVLGMGPPRRESETVTPTRRRWIGIGFTLHLLMALTLFLWGPWLVYGVSTLYDWNQGKVNDLSKPPQVLPPTPSIRPSAADEVLK